MTDTPASLSPVPGNGVPREASRTEASRTQEPTRREELRASRPTSPSRTEDIALIGVFAALMAVLNFIPPIPMNFGVPITLGTLGVGLAGLILGPWRGAAAMALYVLLGLLGLPIFAGFTGGLGVMAGPTAGYILSWPVAGFFTGLFGLLVIRHASRKWWVPLLAITAFIAGLLSYRLLGIPGMALNMDVSLTEAFFMDLVFWPGDAAKAVIAAVIAVLIHRAFPGILVRR